MAQLNWLYVDETGNRYNVGLFHGDRTGHLMVYCNARIVLIDFHVLQPARYSFFLDEDLCELIIEKQNGGYAYGFDVNREVDTPVNRRRKALERKHWRQTYWFIAGFVALVGLFAGLSWYFMRQPGQEDRQALLAEKGRESTARIFYREPPSGDTLHLAFSFIADGKPFDGHFLIPGQTLPNGMPLEEGDEFAVTYLPGRPQVYVIHYGQPAPRQLFRYQDRAAARHASAHPELTSRQVRCQVETAFSIKGVGGLADFYYQETPPEQNPRHNRITYLRLVRDVPFQTEIQKNCWQ